MRNPSTASMPRQRALEKYHRVVSSFAYYKPLNILNCYCSWIVLNCHYLPQLIPTAFCSVYPRWLVLHLQSVSKHLWSSSNTSWNIGVDLSLCFLPQKSSVVRESFDHTICVQVIFLDDAVQPRQHYLLFCHILSAALPQNIIQVIMPHNI